MEKKSIGAFIAVLRKSSGMTQKDLADRLGVSDKTVSHWERDESAPDLTLIPVIAEVFGVTCDELLRGERTRGMSEEKEPSGKTEKQVKHLLNLSRARFKTRSMISLGLSIAGLLTAMILNFGVNRAYLGFLIGCVFWAAAIICESVFYSHAFSAVSGDDFDGAELNDYKIYVVLLTEKIISAAVIMLGASLPLVIFPLDAFWGIAAYSWLLYGLPIAAATAVICYFAAIIVNNSLIKKRVYALTKGIDIKQHKYNQLKIRCAAVVAAILLTLLMGQAAFDGAVGPEAFVAGTTFNNFADFKTYMETEKPGEYGNAAPPVYFDEYGNPNTTIAPVASQITGTDIFKKSVLESQFYDANGNPITREQALTEYIYDNNGNAVYEFIHLNQEVAYYRYSDAGTDKFSITAYTYDQVSAGNAGKAFINARWAILYFIAAAIGFLVYFRKRAKLGRSI